MRKESGFFDDNLCSITQLSLKTVHLITREKWENHSVKEGKNQKPFLGGCLLGIGFKLYIILCYTRLYNSICYCMFFMTRYKVTTRTILYYHAWKLGIISCSSLYLPNHLHSICNMDSINSHSIKSSSLLNHQATNTSLLQLWSVQHILNNEWKVCLSNNSLSSKTFRTIAKKKCSV